MPHAKWLRVTGQELDLAKTSLFELEHDGENYMVSSDSMARTAEWILRYATSEDFAGFRREATKTPWDLKPVRFTKADLTRLESREAGRRRGSLQSDSQIKLSHLLRTLGDHLDTNRANTFCISWTPSWVIVDYKRGSGFTDRLRFTPTKLLESLDAGAFRRALTAK